MSTATPTEPVSDALGEAEVVSNGEDSGGESEAIRGLANAALGRLAPGGWLGTDVRPRYASPQRIPCGLTEPL